MELIENIKNNLKKHIVFTTHTPEAAGNETYDINKLYKLGFFADLNLDEVKKITKIDENDFS
jgi:starch phosphorylase